MLNEPSKFRLADLAQVSVRYVRIFLQEKVVALSPIKVTSAPKAQPVAVRSPVGQRYQALPSQVSSIPPERLESELNDEDQLTVIAEEVL